MDDRRNYYRVLHIQPDAPAELIRVNYRTLMQKLGAHPDLGGENWSAAHLNDAYRTLSDPERRATYDLELLARYDIETIAQGRAKPGARRPVQPPQGGGNRRTYYRVLQAQHDAPLEILEASHRVLCAANPGDSLLLDDALALLSDPARREIYDRLLGVCDHPSALARMGLELGDNPAYDPVITSYCLFCKRPHARREEDHPDARCAECESPLFPPPRNLLGLARRALTRLSRDDQVLLYFDWPAAGILGRVIDLSPTGMSCETSAPLGPNDTLKISSGAFDAVGSVAHVSHGDGMTTAGIRFLTVCFPQARGNFKSIKA